MYKVYALVKTENHHLLISHSAAAYGENPVIAPACDHHYTSYLIFDVTDSFVGRSLPVRWPACNCVQHITCQNATPSPKQVPDAAMINLLPQCLRASCIHVHALLTAFRQNL